MIEEFILNHFGVNEKTFLEALNSSPSAIGYISGAISEVCLKDYLESKNYEVIRIKEKPSGGNNAKNFEARGDFYIRKRNSGKDEWLVIESKGLKSNSEFRGGKLDGPEKVFRFLKNRIFKKSNNKESSYEKGYSTYLKVKNSWESKNPDKIFPEFRWSKNSPGAECYDLQGLWESEDDLKNWAFSLDKELFTEDFYRKAKG